MVTLDEEHSTRARANALRAVLDGRLSPDELTGEAVCAFVVLKGPRGNLFALSVDPAVRNLEQVKVGDAVAVRYMEALSLTLKKGGKELRSSAQSGDLSSGFKRQIA